MPNVSGMPDRNDLVLIEEDDAALRPHGRGRGGRAPAVVRSRGQPREPGTVGSAPAASPRARRPPALRWTHRMGSESIMFRAPRWGTASTSRAWADFRSGSQVRRGVLLADATTARGHKTEGRPRWRPWTSETLAGRSLLVVGHGAIGRRVAEVARALGMAARGIRRGPLTAEDHARGVEDIAALEALLPAADVVVNLLPHTAETESFWGAQRFARMKPGSTFVNVSRGATVDEEALLAALAAGRPARAILSVREDAIPPAHPRPTVRRVRTRPTWPVPALRSCSRASRGELEAAGAAANRSEGSGTALRIWVPSAHPPQPEGKVLDPAAPLSNRVQRRAVPASKEAAVRSRPRRSRW